MNLEELLAILGNKTRLKILEMLSEEPRYPLEIARELNLTEPAVLKHLTILERSGLIASFKKSTSLGAPRKYYYLKNGFTLLLGFTEGLFEASLRELEAERLTEMERLESLLEEASRAGDDVEAVEKLLALSDRFDRELERVRRMEIYILTLKRRVYSRLREVVELLCESPLERRVAMTILGSRWSARSLEELKVRLRLSDLELKILLEKLKTRLPCIDRVLG